jgi:hypothetical protein
MRCASCGETSHPGMIEARRRYLRFLVPCPECGGCAITSPCDGAVGGGGDIGNSGVGDTFDHRRHLDILREMRDLFDARIRLVADQGDREVCIQCIDALAYATRIVGRALGLRPDLR